MDRPRRAALYARASLDDPEAGKTVELQLVRLRRHAAVLGLDVHAEYAEYADIGPRPAERPRFREMVGEGTGPGRPFDVVLALRYSRDPGSAGEFREYTDRLRMDLVEIWTVD